MGLTQAELAARTGVSLDRVVELADLGIVRANEADGSFRPIDIQRIRVAEAFAESSLAIKDLGRLVTRGREPVRLFRAIRAAP